MENMQSQKFTDIDIVNRAGTYHYCMGMPETDELLIVGDRGYPHYYRIEIRFLEVEYIACSLNFDEGYIWRIASPEETKAVHRAFSQQNSSDPDVHFIVYCLEENYHPSLKLREALKFFIAARAVEIIVHYDANNSSHVALLGGIGKQDDNATHTTEQRPLRVLFLCTHNSSRSQMAEGLLRARGGGDYEVFSAGTEPGNVHPLAIRVMRELAIDISQQTSKGIDAFQHQPPMDLVVTVCDEAQEACPFFPNARRQVHWGFPDPSRVTGNEEERLTAFRHVRDLIAASLNQFLERHPFR